MTTDSRPAEPALAETASAGAIDGDSAAAKAGADGLDGEQRATRKRGDELVKAVFDALLELLHTQDYDAITMDCVANAAHTGKAALYRRWHNKEELVYAALVSTLPDPEKAPVHGNVRDDILELLNVAAETMRVASAAAFHSIKNRVTQNGDDQLHEMLRRRCSEPCRRLVLEAIERGVQRGEVRADAANPRVAAVGQAMITQYYMTNRTNVPEEYVASIVDDVVMPILRP
jgi:AcrR family transcriptional regulator